jgi:hypothetical protein
VIAAVVGPIYLRAFLPLERSYSDFIQEWLSVRNYFAGQPIYRDVSDSLVEHIKPHQPVDQAESSDGTKRRQTIAFTDPESGAVIAEMKYNAHPPFAVLVAVPFATLEYRYAHLAWNLVTFVCFVGAVALVVRGLEIPFPWPAIFPTVILLLGNPVLVQIHQGQLNFVLGTLVIAAWAADRADRPRLAGIAIGLAGALKLYPLFLLAYFAFTRRWGGLVAGIASFLAANAITAAVFGAGAFRDYFGVVVPTIAGQFQTNWQNISLTGFWLRLFETDLLRQCLAPNDAALAGHVIAKSMSLGVVGLIAWACVRATDSNDRDRAFALTVVGMLLVSPITWGHYSLLLVMPLVLELKRETSIWRVGLFYAVLAALWLPPNFAAQIGLGQEGMKELLQVAYTKNLSTFQDLTMISVPHYALLGMFLLLLIPGLPHYEPLAP